MASLIAPLASGINGAPSGTAEIFRRGTSTNATVYSDKDALTQVTVHALDANGGVTRYVTQSVDVVVRDAAGNSVRTFTWEDYAASVEVRNAGFTGTLPNGSQGGGGRTDVNTVLSSLYDSLGSLDGKVVVSGVGQRLRDVIGASTALFFNVKTYGAVGNGTTDDSSAIQLAINTCITAGGGVVYFPMTAAGSSYLVNTSLNINTSLGIHLMGAGPGTSIRCGGSSTFALTMTGAGGVVASNLSFTAASGTSGCVSLTGPNRWFVACSFTHGGGAQAPIVLNGNGSFFGCLFVHSTAGSGTFLSIAAGVAAEITGGTVTASAVSPPSFLTGGSSKAKLSNVEINYTAGSGTYTFVPDVTMSVSLSGCLFNASTGNTLNVTAATTVNGAGVYESGCILNANSGTISMGGNYAVSGWRDHQMLRTSTSAITYTPDVAAYAIHEVISSGASFQFANPTTKPNTIFTGNAFLLILRYKNTSGGAITPTFGGNYRANAVSVANNSASGWLFYFDTNLVAYVQVGSPVAYAS